MKLIAVFAFLLMPIIVSADLIFTEVKLRGESPDESYIKIFNQGDNSLDISGYRIRKRSSTGRESSIRVFPKGSIISPKSYFLWANSRNNYHLSLKADVWSTAGISSNNSIALFSSDGRMIDSLAWGEGKNQFFLSSPFPQNPEKNQLIKRRLELGYINSKDNSNDFYLYPKKEIDFLKSNSLNVDTQENKNNSSALFAGIGVALLSSLSILTLKRNL